MTEFGARITYLIDFDTTKNAGIIRTGPILIQVPEMVQARRQKLLVRGSFGQKVGKIVDLFYKIVYLLNEIEDIFSKIKQNSGPF